MTNAHKRPRAEAAWGRMLANLRARKECKCPFTVVPPKFSDLNYRIVRENAPGKTGTLVRDSPERIHSATAPTLDQRKVAPGPINQLIKHNSAGVKRDF